MFKVDCVVGLSEKERRQSSVIRVARETYTSIFLSFNVAIYMHIS